MKIYSKYTFFIILFCFICGSYSWALELTILHTNDQHGHFVKFNILKQHDVGGLASRTTLIKEIRSEVRDKGGYILLLDGGDLNTGEPASDLVEAEPDLKLMDMLGYDAMVLGNHEFDNPLSTLKKQQSWVSFPFLSANLIDTSSGKNIFKPYIIKKIDGLKVAILGLTTDETPDISTYGKDHSIRFNDPLATASTLVNTLKNIEKVDYIIALTHLGHERDKELLNVCPDINLVVGGHSHKFLPSPIIVRDSLILQAGSYGIGLGRLDLTFDKCKKIKSWRYNLIPLNLQQNLEEQGEIALKASQNVIPEDPETLAFIKPYIQKSEDFLSSKVGEATEDITLTPLQKAPCSTAIGNLVADSMRLNVKADVAFQNFGGIRAEIPKGKVSYQTLRRVLPFSNTIIIYRLKGAQLLEIVKETASRASEDSGFLEVSGIEFKIDKGVPMDIKVGGFPLDIEKEYVVATNSFVARGGDRYQIFTTFEKTETGSLLSDALGNYFKTHSPVTPDTAPRVSQKIQ